MTTIGDTERSILKALSRLSAPAGCGEIARTAGLPTPKVVPKMRGLLKAQLVERPLEGKYILSKQGRDLLR